MWAELTKYCKFCTVSLFIGPRSKKLSSNHFLAELDNSRKICLWVCYHFLLPPTKIYDSKNLRGKKKKYWSCSGEILLCNCLRNPSGLEIRSVAVKMSDMLEQHGGGVLQWWRCRRPSGNCIFMFSSQIPSISNLVSTPPQSLTLCPRWPSAPSSCSLACPTGSTTASQATPYNVNL